MFLEIHQIKKGFGSGDSRVEVLKGIDLDHYQEEISNNMLSKYQYMLAIPAGAVNEEQKLKSMFEMMLFEYAVKTDNEDAEKFSAWSLKTIDDGFYKSEEIICYGIEPDSRYIKARIPQNQAYISLSFAEKYNLGKGDTITLKEAYEDTTYDFKIAGIYNYQGALAVLLRYMMILEMTGWIPIYLPAWVYIRVFLIGVLSYLAVAVFEYRKIGKVPMDEALKNVE